MRNRLLYCFLRRVPCSRAGRLGAFSVSEPGTTAVDLDVSAALRISSPRARHFEYINTVHATHANITIVIAIPIPMTPPTPTREVSELLDVFPLSALWAESEAPGDVTNDEDGVEDNVSLGEIDGAWETEVVRETDGTLDGVRVSDGCFETERVDDGVAV